MKLLLDTHTFLWFIQDSPSLDPHAKGLLESEAELLLSVASLWEMAIKISVGKLSLKAPFDTFIPEQLSKNSIELFPISIAQLGVLSTLPFHHRDPFDRLLVCQAIVEQIPVVSIDDKFDSDPVKRLWSKT